MAGPYDEDRRVDRASTPSPEEWKYGFREINRRLDEAQKSREIMASKITEIENDRRKRIEDLGRELAVINLQLTGVRRDYESQSTTLADIRREIREDLAEKRDVEMCNKRMDTIRNWFLAVTTPVMGGLLMAALRVLFSHETLPGIH